MMRSTTEKESLRILKSALGEDEYIRPRYENHKLHKDNTYRITINMLSLSSLLKLIENPKVDEVYFHPSAAPPDSHISSIASRYILYIKYKKTMKRTRKVSK